MTVKLESMSKLLSFTCIPCFKEIGYAKKKEGIFFKKYDDGLYLRIGFNESEKTDDHLTINPMFGVGWLDLETLLCELAEEKNKPYLYPSFSSNIGGFDKENEVVKFTFSRGNIDKEVNYFKEYLNNISLKTEERFAKRSDLLEGLTQYRPLQQYQERLACYHFLLNDKLRVSEVIENEKRRLSDYHPSIQEEYDVFYQNMKAKLI